LPCTRPTLIKALQNYFKTLIYTYPHYYTLRGFIVKQASFNILYITPSIMLAISLIIISLGKHNMLGSSTYL
ncbi:MAG: hypothetical protein LZ174_09360, partial [Thaumarchaeota archaeon]|nr:hypothetical protein [Candidatus Geocrenenecus arthurdayi]